MSCGNSVLLFFEEHYSSPSKNFELSNFTKTDFREMTSLNDNFLNEKYKFDTNECTGLDWIKAIELKVGAREQPKIFFLLQICLQEWNIFWQLENGSNTTYSKKGSTSLTSSYPPIWLFFVLRKVMKGDINCSILEYIKRLIWSNDKE